MPDISYVFSYLVTAWIAADFISGVGHWIEDRYFRVDWPIIGKWIAEPNERHHREPTAFLKGSYIRRNWTTFLVTFTPAFLFAYFGHWWIATAFALASHSNEVHAWSHRPPFRLVRVFQDTGLLQSPRQHAKHHKAPFDCRYCAMTDMLNPVLDGVNFWAILEWMFSWLGFRTKS